METTKKTKVWDGWVRAFHLLLGLGLLGSFVTGEEEELVPWHARIGLALAALLVFRLAWGLWGSRHARFSDFVRGPRTVLAYVAAMVRGRPPHVTGHNPVGALMVVSMLGLLALTVLTGVLVYAGPEWEGALAGSIAWKTGKAIREVHETLAEAFPALIVLHVLGVVGSSLLEKQNLPLGMVTGYKRVPAELSEPAQASWLQRGVGAAAALVLAGLAAFGLSQLFAVPEAKAANDEARAMLAAFEGEQRAAEPAFSASLERGRKLYATEITREGKTRSCATCHTADPTKAGRSPAGKVISPISPLADPQRFTSRRQADKWFDRNCEEVLGRTCTAGERADFLAYVLAP